MYLIPLKMKYLKHISFFLKNKYLVTGLAFVVWLLFFDKNDFYTQHQRSNELTELEQSKSFYAKEIASVRNELEQLESNPATLEKYAREKFYMKRDNEDVFIIKENQ